MFRKRKYFIIQQNTPYILINILRIRVETSFAEFRKTQSSVASYYHSHTHTHTHTLSHTHRCWVGPETSCIQTAHLPGTPFALVYALLGYFFSCNDRLSLTSPPPLILLSLSLSLSLLSPIRTVLSLFLHFFLSLSLTLSLFQ